MTELEKLGWNDSLEAHFGELNEPGWIPARVAREDRFVYNVLSAKGMSIARFSGRSAGRTEDKGDFPAVGDWVALQKHPDATHDVIHAILPRRSAFTRQVVNGRTDAQVVAANVDACFLVSGLDGDFNPRRIERYLAIVGGSGAEPVVILNKADVCEDLDDRVLQAMNAAPGVQVFPVSAANNEGVEPLSAYLTPGQTVAFVGSSGVGKSTLINLLLGEQRFDVYEVREDDSRGRHTTTRRELVVAPNGAILIDTPGMRGLSSWTEEGMASAFSDIEDLARNCRFRDCSHGSEPGCAVREAAANGDLDDARLRNYEKLQREADVAGRRRRDKELGKIRAKYLRNHR